MQVYENIYCIFVQNEKPVLIVQTDFFLFILIPNIFYYFSMLSEVFIFPDSILNKFNIFVKPTSI